MTIIDDGELAALREALEDHQWDSDDGSDYPPFHCGWCRVPEPNHSSDCSRQRALSGERSRQLADVLEAAQLWYEIHAEHDGFDGITAIGLAHKVEKAWPELKK